MYSQASLSKFAASALVVLLCLISTGCVSTSELMQSWVGTDESELLSRWGAPDSSAQTNDGRKILTWKILWNDGANIYTCRKSFTIGKDAKVEKWSYAGCPQYQLK
jgi:hypothetical protein